MKKIALFIFALASFSLSANAAFLSVDDRAEAISAKLQGNNSYHAHLARQLADVASAEKAQHDLGVAKQFIQMAEEEAAKAGGAQ